ncbi:MAG: FAD-dependent oxidoreductase [Ktedonobacterales bacterium]
MGGEQTYDVVVVGAGLGGLLAAAQFLRRGQRVLVVERLAHPGGRFTAKTFQGAQVSTGAVHMLPFGANGELAGMLRALGMPHPVHDADVFGSFHVRGNQYVCRSILQLAGVLGVRQFAELGRIGAAMLLRPPRPEERALSFREWLDRRASQRRSPELYAYFERMCHFALSVDLANVSYPEIVEITKNMLRYGPPGIVDGGCAAMTGELERRVNAGGGEVRLQQDVLGIEHEGAAATGVRVRDRQSGEESVVRAPLIISNIGPEATRRLTGSGDTPDSAGAVPARPEASGLKVHLLSDRSIIPHKGIMYCLDTQRIAGIVQPSNSDRRLAPPGKHLLITHQILRGEDMNAEREAARADLRYLFGEEFGKSVTILTMSQYRGEWPVNRATHGDDVSTRTELAGLYLVGDAVKPSGYLMVEGVAQSVNSLLDALDGATAPGHTPAKPSRARALHWLVSPPPPSHAGSASRR